MVCAFLMSRRFCAVAIALSALHVAACDAFAWSGDGHEIVARIAESRLTPRARAAVKDLLDGKELHDVARWADEIREQREETAPWHYVNIPFEMKGFDPGRDGKNGNNVIDKTRQFALALADARTDRAQRVEALKFLVHFIGDMHQPMHCVERNEDRGGNFLLVFFPGERQALSLHRVWDSNILRLSFGEKTSPAQHAVLLAGRVKDRDARTWSRGDPIDWANEAHALAVEFAYDGIPAEGPPRALSAEYLSTARDVVDVQLTRAGVRLAYLLNRALG